MMTALGAAIVAAITLNLDPSGLSKLRKFENLKEEITSVFYPKIDSASRNVLISGWRASIKRSLHWTDDTSSKPIPIKDLLNYTDTIASDAIVIRIPKVSI